jgi:hypothetical protein
MHSRAFHWFSAAPLVFLFLAWVSYITAESNLADFVCYAWRKRGGGGRNFAHFLFDYFFRMCSFSILVVFPIFKLLNDEGKATSNCRINFKLLVSPSLPLFRMHILIFLFGPYFRCIQVQEKQAVAWGLSTKE